MQENSELMWGGDRDRLGDYRPINEPEIIESGDRSQRSPFPLTAAKLEAAVRRGDTTGPMALGPLYSSLLRKECALLLPRPVMGIDDPAFTELRDTWNRNFSFFRCRAIGDVLARYETMRWNNADREI